MRVLFVDDDPTWNFLQNQVKKEISSAGLDIDVFEFAKSADLALETLTSKEPYDLVVCDSLGDDRAADYQCGRVLDAARAKNRETRFLLFSGSKNLDDLASKLGVPSFNKKDFSIVNELSKCVKGIMESNVGHGIELE